MVSGPALYVGQLRHRRFRPRPHAFTYNLFLAFLDIDRIADQMRVSPLASHNSFNWASFRDADHLLGRSPFSETETAGCRGAGRGAGTTGVHDVRAGMTLRTRLQASAREQSIALPDGPVYVLTHLRYLGYHFNPISFFYCYDGAGALHSILGEVNNTFGEQQTYWLPAAGAVHTANGFRTRVPKTMHVSPFMGMNMDYEFVLTEPRDSLVAHMTTTERGVAAPLFDATLTLERRPWTASALHHALARHPWMTAKVIGAIHWEALRLWMKGVPRHAHPRDLAARERRTARRAGHDVV